MVVVRFMKGMCEMLIVALVCFLSLVLAWLLVPGSARAEAPRTAITFVAAEATGD
jgi:hypothetical protein